MDMTVAESVLHHEACSALIRSWNEFNHKECRVLGAKARFPRSSSLATARDLHEIFIRVSALAMNISSAPEDRAGGGLPTRRPNPEYRVPQHNQTINARSAFLWGRQPNLATSNK